MKEQHIEELKGIQVKEFSIHDTVPDITEIVKKLKHSLQLKEKEI